MREWRKAGLAWTENKVSLNNNKSGSLGHLKSHLRQLKQNRELFKTYDQVIRDDLVDNVIENVSENQSENLKEYFLPQRPVIRQNEASTKLRVVYDALATSEPVYSLNHCLKRGPSLQNKL